ncbi:MAG: hypothetical protein IJ618_02595 [Prevotella sp.]|nr:hypothetical protein [Prevotella sp.]
MIKNRIIIVFLLILANKTCAVTVETTTNLNVYYPEYSRIDLVCGQMPKAADKSVEFCCEAAFTGELLNEFKHSNIADNHICTGVMKKGYRCKTNTGGFVWGKGKWSFMRKADFPKDGNGWNMGFCQLLIVYNAEARPIGSKMRKNRTVYRALCEKNGRLCIVESKKVVAYEDFVKYLVEFKVRHALYLDMGGGWNYAWYRDKDGKVKVRFPESKKSPSYKYRTNWITFYSH